MAKWASGKEMVRLALEHLGQQYILGAVAPKNDPNWDGPWDCAELVSWAVYQVARILYGCVDNTEPPEWADAYTGAWQRDARQRGRPITVARAAAIPGAAVLRVGGPKAGHIVLSDGKGGTVEAHSAEFGVIRYTLSGRRWDLGILVPGITYVEGKPSPVEPPAGTIYRLTLPYQEDEQIRLIQARLAGLDFKPGAADGVFGPATFTAVLAFQRARGLVADGEVGPQTWAALFGEEMT